MMKKYRITMEKYKIIFKLDSGEEYEPDQKSDVLTSELAINALVNGFIKNNYSQVKTIICKRPGLMDCKISAMEKNAALELGFTNIIIRNNETEVEYKL